MPRKVLPTSRAFELSGQALATKEVVGVRGLETRQALERADAVGAAQAEVGGSARARTCSRVLEVDHLAGQLGLDTAQLGPAGGRAGRDVRQHAARLVDGHGERRPHEGSRRLS